MENFKLIPSTYLVLIKDAQILLSQRFNTGYEDGNYSLISGHLNGDETLKQAVIKRAMTGFGIKINPEKLKALHIMHRSRLNSDSERIDIFMTAEDWEGEINNLEPQKYNDLSWFPLNQLPENTIPYIKQAIDCMQKKIFYSEFGFEDFNKF